MDGRGIIEVLGVLVVAFIFGGVVPVYLVLLFVKLRGGNAEMHQLIAHLKAGKVNDLIPWERASLGELAREWVGHSRFTKSMFGRDDQAGGHVPSTRAPSGSLLAFGLETKRSATDGKVWAMTSANRLELAISGGVYRATLDGKVLGSFRPGEPALQGPDGAQLGTFVPRGQLIVRGRPVATIATPGGAASTRPSSLTPLVTELLADRTPEDEAWTLVMVVFQLARASTQ